MLKTGLSRLEDLTDFSALKGFFGGRRSPSIALYEAACALPDGERWAEEILRNSSGARGIFMRSYTKRFEEFDDDVIELIRARWAGQPIAVHDVASSDARTSVDFFRRLSRISADVTFTASDNCNSVSVLDNGHTVVTLDAMGAVLEIARRRFVFNMTKHESFRLYPINLVVREVLARPAAKRVIAMAARGKIKPRPMQLVCCAARELSRDDRRFKIANYNLLDPPPGRFQVVRAMNILNPSYFADADLAAIVRNVISSLNEGGLLIVGSNEDAGSAVRGAAYERRSDWLLRVSSWHWALPAVDAIVTSARL
jgi:CheR methyltransferase, SAM binding domain